MKLLLKLSVFFAFVILLASARRVRKYNSRLQRYRSHRTPTNKYVAVDRSKIVVDRSNVVVDKSIKKGLVSIKPQLHDINVAYAMYAINQRYGTPARTALRVISATMEVSSGIIYQYRLAVTTGQTDEVCNVTVVSKPWLSAPSNLFEKSVSCPPTVITTTQPPPPTTTTTFTTENSTINMASIDGTTRIFPFLHQTEIDSSDPEAREALVHFVDPMNAIRSIYHRIIPYDVKVWRVQFSSGVKVYLFSLRMAMSSCTKLDRTAFGKISLKDCPPLRPKEVTYDGPKCNTAVFLVDDKYQDTRMYVCPKA